MDASFDSEKQAERERSRRAAFGEAVSNSASQAARVEATRALRQTVTTLQNIAVIARG